MVVVRFVMVLLSEDIRRLELQLRPLTPLEANDEVWDIDDILDAVENFPVDEEVDEPKEEVNLRAAYFCTEVARLCMINLKLLTKLK
jgi:hypothetical protein